MISKTDFGEDILSLTFRADVLMMVTHWHVIESTAQYFTKGGTLSE